jgi:hypothetical protein
MLAAAGTPTTAVSQATLPSREASNVVFKLRMKNSYLTIIYSRKHFHFTILLHDIHFMLFLILHDNKTTIIRLIDFPLYDNYTHFYVR